MRKRTRKLVYFVITFRQLKYGFCTAPESLHCLKMIVELSFYLFSTEDELLSRPLP